MPEINITSSIYPTEDENKIIQSIINIFPDAEIQTEPNNINAQARELNTFIEKLARQKIRDSAKGVLWKSIRGTKIKFYLGKQAAFMGKVNFADGRSVLGDLEITINTDDPNGLVQHITFIEREDE